MKTFDLTRYSHHLFPERDYIALVPCSVQEHYDLYRLLNPIEMIRKALDEQAESNVNPITYAEIVGQTTTGEQVWLVVCIRREITSAIRGGSFAIICPGEAELELAHDLRNRDQGFWQFVVEEVLEWNPNSEEGHIL
jgi:hypothetical protein